VAQSDDKKIIAWAIQTHALSYFNKALAEAIDEEHHH
jgi:hypothetical protein